MLLDEVRGLVNRAEVKLAMREFTGLARGRVAIKASQTIRCHFLPARLVDFYQAYPGVALVVSVGNSTEVVVAIIRGDIELGFGNEAVLAVVLAGAGATILSERVCSDAIRAGTLKRLPISVAPRGFYGMQHADRYRSRAVSSLLQILHMYAAS